MGSDVVHLVPVASLVENRLKIQPVRRPFDGQLELTPRFPEFMGALRIGECGWIEDLPVHRPKHIAQGDRGRRAGKQITSVLATHAADQAFRFQFDQNLDQVIRRHQLFGGQVFDLAGRTRGIRTGQTQHGPRGIIALHRELHSAKNYREPRGFDSLKTGLTPRRTTAKSADVRRLLAQVLLVLWVTACSPSANSPSTGASQATPSAARTTPADSPTNRVGAAPRFPVINPVTPVQGRVTFVNQRLKFVIVDFTFHQLPRLDQRLGVYRRDVRVGEVKISGPADGPAIIADVMSGEAGIGDLVREEVGSP